MQTTTIIFILIVQVSLIPTRGTEKEINDVTTGTTTFRLIFMAPSDVSQNIELNSRVDNFFSRSFVQTGWQIEAHQDHTFFLYLLAVDDARNQQRSSNTASTTIIRRHRRQASFQKHNDSSTLITTHSINMQFYLYLTSNPNSCDDYLDHTHLPLLVEHDLHRRRPGLYKAPVSLSLTHSDQPYFFCLSDAYFIVEDQNHMGNDCVLSKYIALETNL